MAATEQTILGEALLMIAIVRRIPRNRWISTTELRQMLADSGINVMMRRMQRMLKQIIASPDLHVEVDQRSKPFAYRRSLPDSDLAAERLTPQESLLLRLCQERLRYQMPAALTQSMEPLFNAASDTLRECSTDPKARGWLQKVAFAPASVPMLPPKVKQRIFDAVSEALFRDSKLRVKFRNRLDAVNEADISPLGLVQQDLRLYLVCRFDGYEDCRHLALHRILEARVLEFPADRPKDFSLDAYVASRHFNYSDGRKVKLEIEFTSPETAVTLSETPFNAGQILEQLPDGAWRLEAVVDDTVLLTGWIEAWRGPGGFRQVRRTPV